MTQTQISVKKIISGCQTGADQGALAAARALGLETGGFIPYGWRTDEGPRQDLAQLYGLTLHASEKYPPRTKCNVRQSDGTLIFGNFTSPGCKLTIKYCCQFKRPYWIIAWKGGTLPPIAVITLRDWCNDHKIQTLNVAGNREQTNPGIHDAVKQLIIETFKC